MDDKLILNGIDACRPGAQDLESPELAALRDRLQQDPALRRLQQRAQRLDSKIRDAMHDVPVPAGFEQRLLARVAAAHGLAVSGPTARDAELVSVSAPAADPASKTTRRHWLQLAAALAASMLVAASLWSFWPRGSIDPITAENIVFRAGDWHEQVGREGEWHDATTAPAEFPLAKSGLQKSPTRWSDATDLIGAPAVAYELPLAGGRKATLFVIRQKLPGVDPFPPNDPQTATAGRTIASWGSEDLLYVLVMDDEDPRTYHRLIDSSPPEMA